MKKQKLITILKLAKDSICLRGNSYYICVALANVYLDNPKWEKKCIYLADQIRKRLGRQKIAEEWLYKKHKLILSKTEMRQWRGKWIDMLVAEIEEHGRLK
jgi:hypothetical protein